MRKINILAACMTCMCFVWAQDVASFQREIAEKAKGLEIVGGGIPGTILVAGRPAFPLVAGRVGKASVPVAAAATFEKGRIVALSHEGFISHDGLAKPSNREFLLASLRWLSGDAAPKRICLLKHCGRKFVDAATAAQCAVQVLDRVDELDAVELPAVLIVNPESYPLSKMAKVREFVKRGGGALCTVVGWGWLQVSGKTSFQTESSFNALAGPAGLYTNGDSVDPVEGKRFATVGSASRIWSCEAALALLDGKAEAKEDDARQASYMLTAFGPVLPPDDRQYRPALEKIVEGSLHSIVPSPRNPLTVKQTADRLALSLFLENWQRNPEKVYPAHPAARAYPGVPESKQRETRTITVDLSVPRWHGTGLFAVAGEPVTVTLEDGAEREGLRVRIGTTECRNVTHDKWMRAPVVTVEVPLRKAVTTFSSPFGGMIYVVVPHGKSGKVNVKVGPACPAPWFVQGRDTADTWKKSIRSFPAPFAEIESDQIVFTVPSSCIRELDAPQPLLDLWKETLEVDAELTALPLPRRHAERICADVQLCMGYMHSGYPIMIPWHSAKHLVNVQTLRAGREDDVWGFFHEMGHNHQNYDWTFDGTTEVTVNFFTLACMERICGRKPRQTKMGSADVQQAYARWEKAGHPYDMWKGDPFLALEFFVRLRERYGWEPFKKMFAEYRKLTPAERPKNDYEKRQQWARRFSRIVGEDLCEQFNRLRNPGEPPFTPPQDDGQK